MGCGRNSPASDRQPAIAVSSTILEAAVSALYGERVELYAIIPPGSCPGHYDLTPRDLARISSADLILLHDYQESMRQKLTSALRNSVPVVVLSERGSLITPPGYRRLLETLAREVPPRLPPLAPFTGEGLRSALAATRQAEAEARAAGGDTLAGKPVAVAHFQAEFCRFWGMAVVAEIDPSMDLSAKTLEEIMRAARDQGALAVVGNEQSGRDQFQVLADRLGLPLVMLSNFPAAPNGRASYPELLLANVRALANGIAKP